MKISLGVLRLKTARQFSLNVFIFTAFSSEGRSRRRRHAFMNFANSASHTGNASRKYFSDEPRLKNISEPLTAAGRTASDMRDAVAFHLCTTSAALST